MISSTIPFHKKFRDQRISYRLNPLTPRSLYLSKSQKRRLRRIVKRSYYDFTHPEPPPQLKRSHDEATQQDLPKQSDDAMEI